MYKKRFASMISCFVFAVLLFAACCYPSFAADQPAEKESTVVSEEEPVSSDEDDPVDPVIIEPLDLQVTLSANLYRSDRVMLDIANLSNADKIETDSSNPVVATITKSGKIFAKKCGRALLSIKLTYRSVIKTVCIDLKVTKSSYRSKKNLSLYAGEKSPVQASSSAENAKIHISSGKSSVIAFTNKTLCAKKKGSSRITVSVQSGERKASVRFVLHVDNKPQMKVTNAMEDNWFKGSIMAGHSVGIGFQMYCNAQYNGFLGNAMHISVGSYGVYNDMAPVTESSLHPTVNGIKARLKDHVKMLGAKKVFINYGLNDIGMYGPEEFVRNYKILVNELLRQNRKTTVYIVSSTPMYSGKGILNNENMKIANHALAKFAKKKSRTEFIDVYTPLLDYEGKLKAEYCSDAYCHMTFAGYDVYARTLKAYAKKKIITETNKKDAVFTKKETAKTTK